MRDQRFVNPKLTPDGGQPNVDDMTPPPTLQELIDTVRADAGTGDPLRQLETAAAAAADLEQTTDALLGHFVSQCRRAGQSWSQISAALGVTKQAVHKRFAGPLAERLAAAGPPSFERFTARARAVLQAARAAATGRGDAEVAAGHLLLALFSEPEAIAAKVLAAMGVSAGQAAAALPAAAGPAAAGGDGGRVPWSADARQALTGALAAALELGHNYIGTEHLLLGLLEDEDSLAARALAAAGARRAEAQARIAELLRGYGQP
jgi:ATP-dependent Clp protease ATP-binding subunit ClpA